jgi:hypothetical protein
MAVMFDQEVTDMPYDMFEVEQNLRDSWRETTSTQRLRGVMWYPAAHDFAEVISNGDVVRGSGVTAAASPNKGWNDNRRIAVDAFTGIFGGQVGDSVRKMQRIMNGERPENVLPMGKKTGHFYMNILDPNDPAWVTIDRHAIRVATSDWTNGQPRITEAQYPVFVRSFVNVATSVGVMPCAFQAALWIYARERVGRG